MAAIKSDYGASHVGNLILFTAFNDLWKKADAQTFKYAVFPSGGPGPPLTGPIVPNNIGACIPKQRVHVPVHQLRGVCGTADSRPMKDLWSRPSIMYDQDDDDSLLLFFAHRVFLSESPGFTTPGLAAALCTEICN